METRIYSVEEITAYIKNLIELDRNLQSVLVKGEISNFKQSDSNFYFSLKDEHSIIDCIMFKRSNKNITFLPKEGMSVVVYGYIELYEKKGRYQLIAEEMQQIGQGELYLRFLQTKDRLEKEGLFREESKKQIPRFPGKIGVVSSLEGAAIRDVIKTIKKRYPHLTLIIYPSFVQGDEAKFTICKGIEALNSIDVDVILLVRGGGSFEDLWPFNEEIVARAISNSKIPIITGVGHETDFTIADFVADKRAHTPSAAAELAVPDEQELLSTLSSLKIQMCRSMLETIKSHKLRADYYFNNKIFRKPRTLFEDTIIKLNSFKEKLNALSPYSVLKRGYSITLQNDKIVSSIKNINKGPLSTVVQDGEILSEVKEKNERKII